MAEETWPADMAAAFGRALRAAGVPVGPDRSARFARAIGVSAPRTRTRLYWVARATLVSRREHVAAFDAVFAATFDGTADVADARGDTTAPRDAGSARPSPAAAPPGRTGPAAPALPRFAAARASGAPRDDGGEGDPAVLAAASAEERLRTERFERLAPEELEQARALIAGLRLSPPMRRTRRARRGRHGEHVDVRTTLRRSMRTGGDPVRIARRRRRVRPRKVVFLLDVSGSMEPYARALLALLQGSVGAVHAEAFVFATRLTRVTRTLATRDPQAALDRALRAAPDWSGGTRIGEALRAFIDRHGRRGMARGAVVVILSDGWERDDPGEIGRQMARLRRLANRVVWVNPRAAAAEYAPLAGGMAAALPYCDAFLSGHSVTALHHVLDAIGAPQ
ncbi:MAG: uncharacterized protein QOD44_379 [Solirubrobacteraceae bacterium]|nr:uncharacterized protein [Solirubrobacteraceae bacterium]MEA2316190.1 uncharacterized protein [Solirubrobacteraceae bacterium]